MGEQYEDSSGIMERFSTGKDSGGVKFLSSRATYFTLIKAFMCTGSLYLPKIFINGGWLFSSICVIASASLTSYCSLLLVELTFKTEIINYSEIGFLAYGNVGLILSDISLFMCQVGNCCAYTYYLIENTKVVLEQSLGANVPQEVLALCFLILFIGLSWIRKLQIFAKTHVFADMMVMATLGTVVVYGANNMVEESGKAAAKNEHDVYLINPTTWTDAIGFSVFLFEGVGVILPVQEVSAD
jgi:proton-coupled amino acid transporter